MIGIGSSLRKIKTMRENEGINKQDTSASNNLFVMHDGIKIRTI